jgi:hypothetical protein
MRRATFRIAAAALVMAMSGCIGTTSESSFIGDREIDLCEGTYNQCKGQVAGCKLDESFYIEGSFPGQRKFLVETRQGDWKVRVSLFLRDPRLSPGTETEVTWFEPGCTDEYKFKLSKSVISGDLFEQAGRSQVFEVEQNVVEPGDHLITVWSDAVCRYLLRVEVLLQDN